MLPIHSMSRRSIPLIALRSDAPLPWRSCVLRQSALLTLLGLVTFWAGRRNGFAPDEVLPKHVNADTIKAVRSGLDHLAATQGSDGAWGDAGGRALSGGGFLAGRHGVSGPRQHAHSRTLRAPDTSHDRILAQVRATVRVAHRPRAGLRATDARTWLRHDVFVVRLWHGD